jgi:cell division protein FtsB
VQDFVRRIQKRTLSASGRPDHPLRRYARLVWIVLGAWLLWVGFLSEHSLSRLWRMSREEASVARELQAASAEFDRLQRQWKDPERTRFESERALRRQGWARPDEIIYRIQAGVPDSARR